MTFAIPILLAAVSPVQSSELQVFAAASLQDAFKVVATEFERQHKGCKVRLNFGGSQQLASQIQQGAPADVFASAAPKNLGQVAYDPTTRRVFALNRMVVVVPAGERSIASLHDLSRSRRTVFAAPAVPAGGYTRIVLQRSAVRYGPAWLKSVTSNIVSQEQDVRSVLSKVELGEAQAGVVYASDALSAGAKVRTFPIPAEFQPRIVYPAAVLKGATDPHLALDFIHLLTDAVGQSALRAQGFSSPLVPVSKIRWTVRGKQRALAVPFPKNYSAITLTTLGPKEVKRTYKGIELAPLLARAKIRDVRFVGADDYEQTIPFETLRQTRAILVNDHGVVQVVVPGLKPRIWVKWIVAIDAE